MSSEWEEFCESKGLNAGSEDDYDSLIDSLDEPAPRRPRPVLNLDECRPVELRFATFRVSSCWSKCNGVVRSHAAPTAPTSCQ